MKRFLLSASTVLLAVCLAACAGVEGAQAAATLPATEGPATSASAAATAVATTDVLTASAAASAPASLSPAPSAGDVEVIPLNKTAKPTPAATQSLKKAGSAPAVANAAAAPGTAERISAEAQKFAVKAAKYYDSYGFSSNRYKFTAAELKMLAVVIHMEARGEPYRAKLAVGNVVMNRVLSRGYPGSTIKEVVTRPHQFCYKASVKPSAECLRAARDVLEYEVWVVPQNTYFFRSTGSKSNWGRHKYWGHIDNSAFYTDSAYVGRYNGAAIPPALFERVYKWPQYGCKPAARVRKVQAMLKALGYKVVADGYFGIETKQAVLSFQKANKLTADGIAGPATLRRLISKYGLSKYLKL